MKELIIQTKKAKEVIDITDNISRLLQKEEIKEGNAHLFLTHTTTALTTADLDPGTDLDILDAFNKIIPDLKFRHPHNPSHMPDHLLSSLIDTSLTVPFANGNLILGTWQRIVLIEFSGPRKRRIIVSII